MPEQEVAAGSCSLCHSSVYKRQNLGSHGKESFNNDIVYRGEELMMLIFLDLHPVGSSEGAVADTYLVCYKYYLIKFTFTLQAVSQGNCKTFLLCSDVHFLRTVGIFKTSTCLSERNRHTWHDCKGHLSRVPKPYCSAPHLHIF